MGARYIHDFMIWPRASHTRLYSIAACSGSTSLSDRVDGLAERGDLFGVAHAPFLQLGKVHRGPTLIDMHESC